MIINPIIPIFLMIIICIILIALIVHKKKSNIIIKILIVVLLFIMNLRIMLPNGEAMAMASDMSVLFVVDTSVSMRALDYDGTKERFEGVKTDCCHIVDELSACKFSIITFGDSAQRVIPFTNDTDMVQAELQSIALESDVTAKGSSMNIVKDVLDKTLADESKRRNGNVKFVVFFISDGEITKQGEVLDSFTSIAPNISNGAVLGYGTSAGGKMVNSSFAEEPTSEFYYLYYYDENYTSQTALSKIDENNLNKIASDLGIEYIKMDKTSNVDNKLNDIKKDIAKSTTSEEKIKSYQDTYFYFAIPLVILLIVDFIIQKRRM